MASENLPKIYQLAQNLDQITPDFVKQLASSRDVYSFLGADYGSSQQMEAVKSVLEKVNQVAQQEYTKQADQIKTVDPYFDPQKYYFPADKIANAGEGAAANRDAPVTRTILQLQSQQRALNNAKQAAQTFQQTGQYQPYPTPGQLLTEATGLNYSPAEEAKNLAAAGISGKMSDADIAQANAAAARVGAPLPYPGGKIGNVSNGGLFQNGQEAAQFYDQNGQLDQKAYQQYSATAGGTKQLPGQVAPGTTNQTNQTGQSSGADALVKRVLLEGGDVTHLQNLPFWNSDPNKQEAYQKLQDIFSSPDKLGQYVQQNGIQNLNNYKWWNDSPIKQDAWNYIQSNPQTGSNQSNVGGQASSSQTGSQNNSSGQAQAGGQVNTTSNALDIINNSNLDDGMKALFKQVVNGWDLSKELNTDNIIKSFNDIKTSTIDPYIQQLSNVAIDDVKRAYDYTQGERQKQLESEGINATQNIQNAQNNLEASGMTFTGKGVEQLGAQSAYAQPGTPQAQQSAIPQQEQFGGKYAEGLVNTSNRLISSSSQDQFQKNLTDLSRQAEQQLGSAGSANLVPGVQQLGGITGNIENQKQQSYASTLSSLADQQNQNTQAQKPINLF